MGSPPFAFSVHHFISSVGADAGFAAIIGLAILILLYFAQARETATLRDHAYEAANRIQQLEARLAQQGRGPQAAQTPAAQGAPGQQAAAQGAAGQTTSAPGQPTSPPTPVPAPAAARAGGGQPASPATSASPVPVAPAGVGAPALTAATRLIPSASPAGAVALAPERPGGAGSETPVPEKPGSDAPASEEDRREEQPAAAATTTVEPPPAEHQEADRPAGPPPATVAGAANGAGQQNARPVAAPVAAAAAPPRAPVRAPGAAQARRPAVPPPRSRPPQGYEPGGVPRIWLGLLAVLAVAGVIALLVILTSGGSSSPSTTTASTNVSTPRHASKGGVRPASVTVAVLNGTATNGLARRVATNLSSAGYRQGTVATASDQTRTTTVVSYLPGFKRDALSVAKALKIGTGSVQPIDQSTQAVACPPPASCAANVVVTLGSDLANTQ